MEEMNSYTYEAAFKELQEIVQQIEVGDVDIDQLSDYIKRAATLVKICEAKLTETEEEVQVLLQKLNEEDVEEEAEVEEEDEEYEPLEEEEEVDEMNNPDEYIEEIEEDESEEGDEAEEEGDTEI